MSSEVNYELIKKLIYFRRGIKSNYCMDKVEQDDLSIIWQYLQDWGLNHLSKSAI